MSRHPFHGGADPFSEQEQVLVICCPKCKSQKFDAKQNQWATWRICMECGNEWSGGSVARADYSDPIPPEGTPAPDDLPVVQYTGAAFRDPSKNRGGE